MSTYHKDFVSKKETTRFISSGGKLICPTVNMKTLILFPCCDKHHEQKQGIRESIHISSLTEVMGPPLRKVVAGSQGRKLETRTMEECCSLDNTVLNHLPKNDTTHPRLGPPESISLAIPHRYACRPDSLGKSLIQMTPRLMI